MSHYVKLCCYYVKLCFLLFYLLCQICLIIFPIMSNYVTVIWNPRSCTPGTRQYKVVRTGTYQYILFWIRGGTRKGKIVHTSTDESVLTYDISMAVHTGMYWYVLYGTRRYKEVQPSTKRYTVVQGTVQGGTRQYVLVCTGMY